MILGIIITYQPEISRLTQNIEAIVEQVDSCLIIDNGSKNIDEIINVCTEKGIWINALGKNIGIAGALQLGLRYATQHSYRYIFTLDQDSICHNRIIEILIKCFENDRRAAICCPEIININDSSEWDTKIHCGQKIVDRCPTSGSLCDVNKLNEVDGFNVELFIDEVDHDLCYRLQRKGFVVIKNMSTFLRHEVGNQEKHWFFFRYIHALNHNKIRLYYITRNGFYVIREFKDLEQVKKRRILLELFTRLSKIIIYENNKAEKICSMIRGALHGMTFTTSKSVNIKSRS